MVGAGCPWPQANRAAAGSAIETPPFTSIVGRPATVDESSASVAAESEAAGR